MQYDYKEIAAHIKEFRKARGLTQKQLGAKINRTESSIAKYEQGVVEIPLSVLNEIADALQVDPFSLMDFDMASDALVDSINRKQAAILEVFDRLNTVGQEELIRRAWEMTEVSKYQQKDSDCE